MSTRDLPVSDVVQLADAQELSISRLEVLLPRRSSAW